MLLLSEKRLQNREQYMVPCVCVYVCGGGGIGGCDLTLICLPI